MTKRGILLERIFTWFFGALLVMFAFLMGIEIGKADTETNTQTASVFTMEAVISHGKLYADFVAMYDQDPENLEAHCQVITNELQELGIDFVEVLHSVVNIAGGTFSGKELEAMSRILNYSGKELDKMIYSYIPDSSSGCDIEPLDLRTLVD